MKLLSCITNECMDIVYEIFRYVNSISRLCLHLRDAASVVIELGLEVETFREMMGNSSLGCRARVGQMCRDRESGISVILLMVDLRVVDVLGVDVILDMDELTAIGLSVIGTLAGLSYPTRFWSLVRLHMHVV